MSLTHSWGGGSGQEAVPALSDGMRAPPATEADVVVELEIVVVDNIPPEVVAEILGVNDIDAAVGFANLLTGDIDAAVGFANLLTEVAIPVEADAVKELGARPEAEVAGEIDVDVFAALLSPSGFTGQSFRLFLLLPVPPEFRQRSVPGSV